MSYEIVGIPRANVKDVFPLVRQFFVKFTDRFGGEATESEFYTDLQDGHQQLWVVRGEKTIACAVTKITTSGAVEIPMLAGSDRELWQDDLLDTIEAWGKENGADRMRVQIRPGWYRFLTKRGMRETHRIMERHLG